MSLRMLSRDDLDAFAAILRDGSVGWKLAKAEYEGLREVRYSDLRVKPTDTSKLGNVIGETASYIHSIFKGDADCLAEDTFCIDYDLRTNLLGKAVYGAIDCVDLSFRVNWIVREVVVTFYIPSKPRILKVPNELRRVLDEGKVRDLAKFAEMTWLNERDVGGSEAQSLLNICQWGSAIQCKLTRLVKGCLIYLDHLESGPKTYVRADLHTLGYNVKELMATMNLWETAYVYTKHETNSAYNLALYAMCQQYPSPLFGGVEHVKIPADGDVIILVGYYSPMKHYRNVVVSPELVMGALIEYSYQFCLGEDLESAMIIACSLRQNRYLEEVGLPAVVSNCDLIYPALSGIEAGGVRHRNSILTKEAAVMLGRFHQMACLVLFKDFDTSFRNAAEWTMGSVFCNDNFTLIKYMEDQIGTGIFQMSNDLIWLRYLQDEAMARLGKYSVFEGFWLIKNPLNVLKDGVIKCLKQGVNSKHQIRFGYKLDSFDILEKEVALGGGDSELTISDGAFSVSVACVSSEVSTPMRILSFSHESEVSLQFE